MGLTSFVKVSRENRLSNFNFLAFVLALSCVSSAFADVTWVGGGANTNWTTVENWGGTAPVSTDAAIIPTNATAFSVVVNDGAVANTLSATGSTLTQSSGTATFGTSITINSGAYYKLSGGTLSVPTINLNDGGTLTYSGGTLQGATTGTTPTIAVGTGGIELTGSAFGSDITVSTLLYLGSSSADRTMTSNISGAGAINRNAGGYGITISGIVSVSGGISHTVGGSLTLTNTNTFSGGITCTNGTITITGDSSGVTGGYTTGGTNATNFNINAGAKFSTAASDTISLVTSGTNTQTMTIAGTVNNKGSLFVERIGVLNVNNGGTWTQAGDMTVQGNGGYGANATIASGGTFTYTGSNLIHLNGAPGNNGSGTLTVSGTFATGQGFNSTTTPNSGRGNLKLAGTLKATANIDNLIVAGASAATTPVFTLTGAATIDTQAYNVGISTQILGSGTQSLTKTGTGTLKITSNNNTYTGATTISAGTLDLSDGVIYNTTGGANYSVTVGGGTSSPATLIVANFDWGATCSLGKANFNTGNFQMNNGTLQTTQTTTSGRSITLQAGGGTLNVADNTTLTLSSSSGTKITGTGSLTKTGTGTLILTQTGNDYTGNTTVSAGTLDLSAGVIYTSAYSSSTVTVGGGVSSPATLIVGSFGYGAELSLGQLRVNSPSLVLNNGTIQTNLSEATGRGFTLGAGGGTLNVADTTVLTLTPGTESKITGSGSLTKTGTGTLKITKTGNDYTGSTIVSGGVLDLSEGQIYHGAFASSAWVTINANSTLVINKVGYNVTDTTYSLGGLPANTDRLVLNGGTLKVMAGGSETDTIQRGFTVNTTGGTLYIENGAIFNQKSDNVITLNGPLTKTGTGKFIVNAAPTAGTSTARAWVVNEGVLEFAGSTNYSGGALTVNDGGTMSINGASGTFGIAYTLNGNGASDGADGTLGALYIQNNGVIYSGAGTLASNSTINVKSDVTATLSGALSGTGDLTKIGGGTLTLNSLPTFTGKLIVNEGAVTITGVGDAALGTIQLNGGTLNATGTASGGFRLANPRTVQVTEADKTGTYTGNLNLNGSTYAFNAVADSTLDIQASIWNGGRINVSGEGTVNVSNLDWVVGTGGNGTAPTFTSTAAKVNVEGDIARAQDNTFNLNAGIMSPGAKDNAVGVLTVGAGANGIFNVASGSTLLFDFGQTLADGYDQLVVNGTLNLAAGSLIDLYFADESVWLVPDSSYNFITATLPAGDYTSFLADKWQQYFSLFSNGTGLTLNANSSGAVPEPSTWVLLLLGTAGLMWLRRRTVR